MKSLLKLVALASTFLLVVAMVALWRVHVFVGAPEQLQQLRNVLSERVGGNVTFEKFKLNLLTGFQLTNVQVSTALDEDDPFLVLDRIDLRYAPLELLRKTVRFREVHLQSPHLIIRQKANGFWQVPRMRLDELTRTLQFKTGFTDFSVVLDNFKLSNCKLSVIDLDQRTLLYAGGVGVEGNLQVADDGSVAEGGLFIDHLYNGDLFVFERIQSPLHYVEETLTLPKLSASVHSGRALADVQVKVDPNGPKFNGSAQLLKIDLRQLLRNFNESGEVLDGSMDVNCTFSGDLGQPNLIVGTGSLSVKDARLTDIFALDVLSQILHIRELSDTSFDTITGSFKIAEQKLTFYDLEARSPSVQITGTGSLGFDRKLNLDILLAISPELATQIPSPSAERFASRDDGFRTITFRISGTLDDPKSNLLDKIQPESSLASGPHAGSGKQLTAKLREK